MKIIVNKDITTVRGNTTSPGIYYVIPARNRKDWLLTNERYSEMHISENDILIYDREESGNFFTKEQFREYVKDGIIQLIQD
jgi:hypothetical protein